LDNEDYAAHIVLSALYGIRKEPDKGIAALERAIFINPNGADAYAHLGSFLTGAGKPEEAIELIEKAFRLNPIPPDFYLRYLGNAKYALGQYEDAIELYKRVLRGSPNYLGAHLNLTATYIAAGHEDEARHQAEELRKLDPAFSLDRYAEMLFHKDEADAERYIADLRKAGLK